MNKVPMTTAGAARLREELHELKQVKRPQVIEAIAEARAHGDLKENAEYHAAREEQGFIEGRIQELEATLSQAEIIDIERLASSCEGRIVFGATVELLNIDTDEEVTYQIVGDIEADIKRGKISVKSPIARALIGKEEGDVASFDAPGGLREYEVVEVSYV